MARLVVECPETGKQGDPGLEAKRIDFKRIKLVAFRMTCPLVMSGRW